MASSIQMALGDKIPHGSTLMGHRRPDDARPMTAVGFARLLKRLDSDADRAAAEYERLRLTLVKFFDWRGARGPEECADETLDRLVEKLQGETDVEDVQRYAHGIARLVLLERLRRQAQFPIDELPDPSNLPAAFSPEASELRECFERCLAGLPRESRRLVLQYYLQEGQAKIENRRRLARSAGLSEMALRSRVQRIRDRIERCAQNCVAAAETLGLEEALRHVSSARDTMDMKNSDDN